MSDTNIAVISTLVAADCFVDALISVDPIMTFADKTPEGDFNGREYDSGTTVYIKVEDQPQLPAQSNVARTSPIVQRQRALTALQYNDQIPLPSLEYEYFLGGEKKLRKTFKNRMESIAVQAAINCYDVLGQAMNFVGTAGSDLKTSTDWGLARAVLNDQLSGTSGLVAAVSPRAMANIAGDRSPLFLPTEAVSKAYTDGRIQRVAGFKMFESTILPLHTNGDAVGNGTSGMAVGTNVTTGATSVAVTGGTSAGTVTKNSIIYFKGAYAVQPHTKKTLQTLRFFTVAADVTLSSGAGTITLTEPIYGPENPKLQNISVLPTTSANQYVGIKGTASVTYEQCFFFKEDSFAAVGLKMPDLFALKNSHENYEGVNVRSCAYADGGNSNSFVRWDILNGACIKQPLHIGRAFVAALS